MSKWRGVSTEVKGQRLLIQRLGRLKTSSASAPCLGSTPRLGGPFGPTPRGVTAYTPENPRRTRPVLRIKPTEGQGDGGTTGSALPPIYGSKITPRALDQPAPRFSADPVRSKGSQSRIKTRVPPAATPRPGRKLFRRQEVGGQRAGVVLACSSVSVLNVGRRAESANPRGVTGYGNRKSNAGPLPVAGSSRALASPDGHTRPQGNPRGSAGLSVTGQIKSAPGLYSHDSAIESDSQSSESSKSREEEEEEEYYTDQRIGEWVIRVNASLFSPSESEISCVSRLEEEDVDTIKIIYEQD